MSGWQRNQQCPCYETNSISNQSVSHRETDTLPSISPVSTLIVELPPLEKSKDAAVNTIITFKPDDIVTMSESSSQETSDDDTLPLSHDENLLDHDLILCMLKVISMMNDRKGRNKIK